MLAGSILNKYQTCKSELDDVTLPAVQNLEWILHMNRLMKYLTVIIPVYNEEKYISETLYQVKKLGCNIIVVNDGSTDGTEKLLNQCDFATVVHLPENRGKGFAVKSALDLVDTPFVALQDADSEYPPSSIPILMEYCNFDMVVGSRKISLSGMSPSSFVANKLFQFLLRSPDPFSGQRILKTEFFRSLDIASNGFEIETELTIKTNKAGGTVQYVPVPYFARSRSCGKKIGFADFFDISRFYFKENFDARNRLFRNCLARDNGVGEVL